MNCSTALVSLLVLGGGLVVYVLRKRIEDTRGWMAKLDSELAILGQRLDRLEARGVSPDPGVVPAAQPTPDVEPERPEEPEPVEEEEPVAAMAEMAEIAPEDGGPSLAEEAPDGTPPPSEPGDGAEPPRPSLRVDWEQWVGVRGAALLGGIVLALAAVLFLKFSIERGLIPPIVRVALGLLAGVGAVVGSEILRKRNYATTANALAGAGVVILYASIWAARTLYDLIPVALAFVLMILVTVACGLLSWRHRSLVIAVLGLVGGFATPLLLSTGENRPVGLFGYVLFLDAGLLALARRRGWPLLAALALGGTVFYQLVWIFVRMESHQALLGLGVLAVFGILFALAGAKAKTLRRDPVWRLTSWAGVLAPFAFAVYFAARADLGVELWQLAVLFAILALAALWLGRLHGVALLGTAAAAAIVGVYAVWVARAWFHPGFSTPLAWEAVAVAAGLASVFHLVAGRRERRVDTLFEVADPAFVSATGLLAPLLVAHVGRAVPLWPWLAGWLALAGLLIHQGRRVGAGYRRIVAAAALAVGFCLAIPGPRASPEPPIFFGVALAVAAGFQMLALTDRDRRGEARRANELAATVFPLGVLTGMLLAVSFSAFAPLVFLVTTIALAFFAVLAATRGRLGWIYPVAVGLLALTHSAWVDKYFRWSVPDATELTILLLMFAAVVLFAYWPFLAGRRLAGDRWVLYGSALAAPCWFLALRWVWVSRFGRDAIGALPVLLGLVALGAAVLARRATSGEESQQKRSLVWFLAVALGFVTLAIPLQLDQEWITIGWALQGLAMILLWKRLDHPGLKYFGLALLATTFVRLLLNPAVLGYYQKSARPFFNWLAYTYLVPAGALLGSARVLASLERERLRPWEKRWGEKLGAAGAAACGLAGLLVIFAWINLTILDYFSTGGYLRLSLDRLPARDLSLSLAWAVYALVLLAIGMAKKSVALRWVSLAFLILTIGKVFLYDLGELKDLYRVASLAGLAVSLLLVSLAYQRFVFPAKKAKESDDEEG